MCACYHLTGIGLAWIAENSITLDVRCSYEIRLLVAAAGQASNSGKVMIDSIVLTPDILASTTYARAGKSSLRQIERRFFVYKTNFQ